jgi:hypothetical protein
MATPVIDFDGAFSDVGLACDSDRTPLEESESKFENI